jgi:alpha-1,2-mannosyltransferase
MTSAVDAGRQRAVLRAGYVVALAGAMAWAALIVLAAGSNGTLGFDYRAYDLAVDRLLAGQSMYDPNAQSTGSFGLFFYPPPFALLILPFALLPTDLGVWAWTAALAAASAAAVWLLPVATRVRWIVLLLAALSWPLVYAIKLGQVGPMLLLLFAVAWRWLDRPWPVGIAAGLGTAIKIQPALLVGWALVTGRRRAALVAVAVAGALAVLATVIAGPQSWVDEASLLGRVSRPVLTPNAFGFGRLAYEAGLSESLATIVHWANLALVVALVALVVWRGSTVASFLSVAIASQFATPVLWDHYALILLLPVAWLIDRGQWWAGAIPLVSATLLIGVTPPIAYPVLFWVTLGAVAWLGLRDGRSPAPASVARSSTSPPAPPAASTDA